MKSDRTVQPLIQNKSFRHFARGVATAEEEKKWNTWIEAKEENRQKAREAIAEVIGFKFSEAEIPNVEEEWLHVYEKTIGKQHVQYSRLNAKSNNSLKWFFRGVAALLLIGLMGTIAYTNSGNGSSGEKLEKITEQKSLTTDKGEQKTLYFASGAKIILSEKSSLTYQKNISADKSENSRMIKVTKLKGKAFFKSGHQTKQKRATFEVNTPDGQIYDIGTEFMIEVKKHSSQAVLQQGEIKIKPEHAQQKITIKKGEKAIFNRNRIISRGDVNTSIYTSWATGYMKFDHTKISTFAHYVEKRFKVQVRIKTSQMASTLLSGTVYFDSLDELVRSVSEVTNIHAYKSKSGNTIFIGNPY